VQKWQSTEGAFVDYMNDMWLTSHSTWFPASNMLGPSTNNALESLNGLMKKEGTSHERLPFSRFTKLSLTMVQKWSEQFDQGKEIAKEPTITLKDWASTYQ